MPPKNGLSSSAAAARLIADGPNALPEAPPHPLWRRFLRHFRSPLIYILLFALLFDLASWAYQGSHGTPVEALVIAAVLLLNAGLGTYQEQRSEQALKQLRALAAPQAWVLRDGNYAHIPSDQIVVGDLVRVEAGERVPADGALQQSLGVLLDESVLTGESVPVDKGPGEEVHSGTLLVRGKGTFLVSRTGARSAMGRLATLIGSMEVERTPLERRLEQLGGQIARAVGALAVVLAVAGLLAEGLSRFQEVVLFAVALAVAAVPEGMPAVVTLTLALGVQRMARRKAVVRRLSAVEALGSVTVIATDKTGTLTENQMRVQRLIAADPDAALEALVLANDAEHGSYAGDPLELGLLDHASGAGVDVAALRARRPRRSSRPFDSAWKYMRVTVETEAGLVSYLKGAPEVLLQRARLTTEQRASWEAQAEQAAHGGARVLALARGAGEAEDDLTLLGLVLLWDPPRAEVPEAIRRAQQAGIRVLMITGDHPGTARATAAAIGMAQTETLTGAEIEGLSDERLREALRRASVFARVSPESKLRIIDALKQSGEIVAMTGDGVNDAPALKRSDVGVAMGRRGSDVTREIADLVLLDDNFATMVNAISEGRSIYENIQTFIRFTFTTNVALVLLVVVGAVGSYAQGLRDAAGTLMLPLTALQLLWINFIGDGPPALALALDQNPDLMHQPPRPAGAGLLDRASARFILFSGIFKGLIGIAVLVTAPLLGMTLLATQTLIFLTESVGKLVIAYPARRLSNRPQRNWVLHAAILAGTLLQGVTLLLPGLRRLLSLSPLNLYGAACVTGAVALTWGFAELQARWIRHRAGG